MSKKDQKKFELSKKGKEMIAESLADFFFVFFQNKLKKSKYKNNDNKQGSVRVPHKA